MRRVLSVLVENEPGVLSRVAGLFSGRGFNIESLNVAPTLEDGVSLMTITTSGDEQIIEQIVKQLRKLVTVVKVVDFYGMAYVEREMMVQARRSAPHSGHFPLQGRGREPYRPDVGSDGRSLQVAGDYPVAAEIRH